MLQHSQKSRPLNGLTDKGLDLASGTFCREQSDFAAAAVICL